MITIECYNCFNILGFAYLEENKTIHKIDHPHKISNVVYVRCTSCYGKFQKDRPDLFHTHVISDTR